MIMDIGLRYKEHIASAATKGLEAAMELKRLRGLTPATARRLFVSTVAPAVDYASSVWRHRCKDRIAAAVNRVQKTNPLRKLSKQMRKFRRVFRSPFFEVATALKNLPVDELETIAPFAVAPWTERINTIVDGAEVEPWSEAHRDGNVRIAVSSSARNDLVGVGGVVEMPQVSQGGPKLVKFSFLLGERSGQNVFAGSWRPPRMP
ncbi:conserved hypothetical protein [Verticillium alfalfae VaMs.102]|uniref:Uncharacterized protein n=1 Tax=Verticillium alfalfae (strain VaMs.102 / ATCC MYA-4576 / FGSC 10136) TaxID=526221 RepID=C9SZ30_VERA1|nr:conserved hypothetical protein [Verticillium alfalfae VaMs.102]EEY24045.1 conserved hypothetical protein [Verticillium alfalfae VaMs.102]